MKLTILGCSGSMAAPHSPASSYLLQAEGIEGDGQTRTYSLVMDLGAGTMGAILGAINPVDIDAIALSHLHADHCVDIVGMHVYRKWHPNGTLPTIPVYSPEDGRERTRAIDGGKPEDTYSTFDFHTVTPGDSFDVGPMHIDVFEAWHTLPAVAFRVTGPSDTGKGTVTFTYTGDTDYCDSEVEAARGVDVLLSEAAFEDGRDPYRGVHMNGERAGTLAAEAGVGRLLLTHLQPWTNRDIVRSHAAQHYAGDIVCVNPGDVYTF